METNHTPEEFSASRLGKSLTNGNRAVGSAFSTKCPWEQPKRRSTAALPNASDRPALSALTRAVAAEAPSGAADISPGRDPGDWRSHPISPGRGDRMHRIAPDHSCRPSEAACV